MCKHPMPSTSPDLSRRWRITVLTSRILAGFAAIAFLIMAIAADRSYMLWFFGAMSVFLLLIPELTFEMLIRDFCKSGIGKMPHKVRLLISPVLYWIVYTASPYLFHVFFNLFARHGRTMGGNRSSLQLGIWQTLSSPLPYTFIWQCIFIVGAVFMILTTLGICYLTTSSSWWKRLAAVVLLVALEGAAALCACNSPG